MDTVHAQTTAVSSRRKEKEMRCTTCGSVMAEADRVVEGDFVFIWYECSVPDCTGQWLARRPASAE
jgi:hypothetical protein